MLPHELPGRNPYIALNRPQPLIIERTDVLPGHRYMVGHRVVQLGAPEPVAAEPALTQDQPRASLLDRIETVLARHWITTWGGFILIGLTIAILFALHGMSGGGL